MGRGTHDTIEDARDTSEARLFMRADFAHGNHEELDLRPDARCVI